MCACVCDLIRCFCFVLWLRVCVPAFGRRAVGATSMNDRSSRSHMLISVKVLATAKTDRDADFSSRMYLIDLAGSERFSSADRDASRMRESQSINRSLCSLGDVMAALQQRSKHIPFRNSKLTYLLEDVLGGDNKVLMLVQVSPTASNAQETNCSLMFAERTASVNLRSQRGAAPSQDVVKRYKSRCSALEQQVWELSDRLTRAALAESEGRKDGDDDDSDSSGGDDDDNGGGGGGGGGGEGDTASINAGSPRANDSAPTPALRPRLSVSTEAEAEARTEFKDLHLDTENMHASTDGGKPSGRRSFSQRASGLFDMLQMTSASGATKRMHGAGAGAEEPHRASLGGASARSDTDAAALPL